MMSHVYIPNSSGGQDKKFPWAQDFETSLGKHGEISSLQKIQKISQAWLQAPIVPATQEAEAGESLEPGRRKLQWAEIAPLRSSLGNRARTENQTPHVLTHRWELNNEITWTQ